MQPPWRARAGRIASAPRGFPVAGSACSAAASSAAISRRLRRFLVRSSSTAAGGPWRGRLRPRLAFLLFMEGHPLHGHTFGAAGTVAGLTDRRVQERRLPGHRRAVRKAGR